MNQYTAAPWPARFWANVDRSAPDGCWLWTGAVDRENGYGHVKRDGRPQKAHRVAWELVNGPIPPGALICHHCDVRLCVRPAHLFAGSPGDNARDMAAKGRHHDTTGERHPMARLTAHDVRAIRARWRRGMAPELARDYGVTVAAIYDVASRRTWATLAEG